MGALCHPPAIAMVTGPSQCSALLPHCDVSEALPPVRVLGDGRMRGVALGTARTTISRTPSGPIAKHDFGNSEAPLMSCQQFVTHLPRIHLSRSLVSVRECANSFITEEPCYLRDRKVGVTQVMRGEIGAQLTENFTEAQAFRSQPPRQRPAAHPKRLRDRAELRLAMRQERSDRIFDSDLQRTLSGAAICQRLLAIVEQHFVEMRIRGDETKLLYFLVEDDPVCVRSKLYPASKEFFDFQRTGAGVDERNERRSDSDGGSLNPCRSG